MNHYRRILTTSHHISHTIPPMSLLLLSSSAVLHSIPLHPSLLNSIFLISSQEMRRRMRVYMLLLAAVLNHGSMPLSARVEELKMAETRKWVRAYSDQFWRLTHKSTQVYL